MVRMVMISVAWYPGYKLDVSPVLVLMHENA